MKQIMIASTNAHKIEEFKQMLEPLGYEVKSLLDIDHAVDIEENGTTFEENALIKATYLAKKYHVLALADDSGLEIECLNNAPGIYSARYLGKDTPYQKKNAIVLDKIKEETNRKARFVSSIALVKPDLQSKVFTGYLLGEIGYEAKGNNGFGYDPIFYLPNRKQYLAELSANEKNSISHRANALKLVLPYLEELIENEK